MSKALSLKLVTAASLLALASPAFAQIAAGDVVELTPEQRETALEAGAERSARDLPINGLAGRVHGEIGTEIGSNGSRALYGTAAVPLGENGSAAFSFFTGQSGRWRTR